MKRVYIYKMFERFWHWSQASLIIFLALTGFEVHGTIEIFGFDQAVRFHRFSSYALLILITFSIFWHFTTGEWKQYIPSTKKLKSQLHYYISGIFKGEKHPTHKSELSKLNPLQKLVYLGFKVVLIPVVVISGILYMNYKTIDQNDIIVISEIPLNTIAVLHTLGAFLLISFLVVHVYMTTTGTTPTSNIKAMITGYEEIEHETDHKIDNQKEK
ncbi:MAG: cytochrome b/b6 domain-containing protein [Bacteroidetes bacterium]|nr:cytochrome b/b6 domain-containing protein [Bacteroidota bacterium]